MKVFTEKVGKRSATLTCYVQETAANPDVTPWLNMSLTFLKRIFNKDSLIPEKPDVTEYGLDMRIKRLVTDEKSLPIIMELLPELLDAYQADNSAGDLSPRRLQKYSKGMFDSEKLAALEAALKKLNE